MGGGAVTRRARRRERGSTIIEVMIATTVLIIAATGFAGMSQYAAGATGIGHRRTAAAFARAELIDRLSVMPRSVLREICAAQESTWIVYGCWDQAVRRIEPLNTSYSATFTCPDETYYRGKIRVTDNGVDAWSPTTNAWSVGLYLERTDRGCTPETREASVGCVSADLLLTD
jgi:hypothetical protein